MHDKQQLDNTDERYKNWDMENAKPVSEVPALQKLQQRAKAWQQTQDSVTIKPDLLKRFEQKAQQLGTSRQTIIEQALEEYLGTH